MKIQWQVGQIIKTNSQTGEENKSNAKNDPRLRQGNYSFGAQR
jgi:hypothetical protein